MMKTALSLLIVIFSLPLFAQSTALKDEMIRKTGLGENHFLIQGFSEVNRADFLPDRFKDLAQTAIDIPLGSGILSLSPVTLINLFIKGELEENHRVLLVGEECAYGATALSRAGMEVYLIDPGAPASSSYQLKKDLNDLKGWISMAPFDFILLINMSLESVPGPLINQLSTGGVLVVPLISPSNQQSWIKIKARNGNIDISLMDPAYSPPLF
jgi:protein-L-isoaspartate(D-aspartate) O-methyltransferase